MYAHTYYVSRLCSFIDLSVIAAAYPSCPRRVIIHRVPRIFTPGSLNLFKTLSERQYCDGPSKRALDCAKRVRV